MGKMIAGLCPESGCTLTDFETADVCIDFSHPDVLFHHLEKASQSKKPLVIGTTGWDDKKKDVEKFVEDRKMAVVASANFSLGIYLMKSILKEAARKMKHFPEYDVAGIEVHHSKKVDAPSGTAIALGNVIDENLGRKEKCSFTSVRTGSVPGTHTIFFDSPYDTITLTHTARSREGFARGALFAASWIRGKQGFYTFEDCIGESK